MVQAINLIGVIWLVSTLILIESPTIAEFGLGLAFLIYLGVISSLQLVVRC